MACARRLLWYSTRMPNTPTPNTVACTVTVDFVGGTVTGMDQLAQTLTEFIQEDRVTADDDMAQVMAEALAGYFRTGDISRDHAAAILFELNQWAKDEGLPDGS